MKPITRTINTQGMTEQERNVAIRAMLEEMEQERIRQQLEQSLQRISEMMQQITRKD